MPLAMMEYWSTSGLRASKWPRKGMWRAVLENDKCDGQFIEPGEFFVQSEIEYMRERLL